MEIPDIELVVEGAAEADTNEVGGEEGRNNLYVMVKAKGRNKRCRSWGWGVPNRAKVLGSESPLALPFLHAYPGQIS